MVIINIKKRQTMKKYSIIFAAAALVFAACNKAEIDAPSQDVNPSVETELITVVEESSYG